MYKRPKKNINKKGVGLKINIKRIFSLTKKALPGILSIFALILISIQFYLFIYRSGSFTVTDVQLIGIEKKEGDLAKLISQLKGENIFDIELPFYARKFKELIPEAQDIIITREFPDKLIIHIKTRNPAALLDMNNSRYLIDSSGFVLARYEAKGSPLVPLITGITCQRQGKGPVQIGRQIDAKGLTAALDCLKGLSREEADIRIVKVDAHDPNNIVFYTEDGLGIKARGEDFDSKVKLLAYVLPGARESKAKYIDTRFKDMVVGK